MNAVAAAVGQYLFVLATGVLEGVGEDRQAVERPLLVDARCEVRDGGREPRGGAGDGTKRVAPPPRAK